MPCSGDKQPLGTIRLQLLYVAENFHNYKVQASRATSLTSLVSKARIDWSNSTRAAEGSKYGQMLAALDQIQGFWHGLTRTQHPSCPVLKGYIGSQSTANWLYCWIIYTDHHKLLVIQTTVAELAAGGEANSMVRNSSTAYGAHRGGVIIGWEASWRSKRLLSVVPGETTYRSL